MAENLSNDKERKVFEDSSNINYESFLSEELIKAVPEELIEMFENTVLATLEEVSIAMPFVSLKYFKNKILPRRIAYRASFTLARILVQRMIDNGQLAVEQIEDKTYTEFPISVLKKGKK